MNKNNNKRSAGRPKACDTLLPIDLRECLFCYRVYNKNFLSLQQSIIKDTSYCVKCWKTEIMEKEYEDPLDIQIKKLASLRKIKYLI